MNRFLINCKKTHSQFAQTTTGDFPKVVSSGGDFSLCAHWCCWQFRLIFKQMSLFNKSILFYCSQWCQFFVLVKMKKLSTAKIAWLFNANSTGVGLIALEKNHGCQQNEICSQITCVLPFDLDFMQNLNVHHHVESNRQVRPCYKNWLYVCSLSVYFRQEWFYVSQLSHQKNLSTGRSRNFARMAHTQECPLWPQKLFVDNSAIQKAAGSRSFRLEPPPAAVPATGSIHGLWEFQEF